MNETVSCKAPRSKLLYYFNKINHFNPTASLGPQGSGPESITADIASLVCISQKLKKVVQILLFFARLRFY
jgi:hypothetical protein